MKLFQTTILLLLLIIPVVLPCLAATPDLQSDSELATAGYFQLSWKTDVSGKEVSGDFTLEEAGDPEFSQATTLYSGPDTATLISGRPDGIYYYRIRSEQDTETNNAWSNTTRVEVAHHPLSRAFMFFALGAAVFIATLVVVILGNKSSKQ